MQNQICSQYMQSPAYNQMPVPYPQQTGVPYQQQTAMPMTYAQPQMSVPYGMQPVQYPQAQSYPSASVGAVNIQIFNPTANSGPSYPYNYNNLMQYPQPTYTMPQQYPYNMNQSMNLNNNQNGIAGQGNGEEGKKTEEKKEEDKKPKVALTDDYIRTLENYLNSQDKKIRLMGAKELFERFKEDENRKDDAALTALLNKTLQDPAETVKFMALTALDAGYATGNDETAQILNQMQTSDSSYGEDAAMASRILLKMSGYKANADAAALQNQANLQNPQGQNMQPMNQNMQMQQGQQTMPQPTMAQTQDLNMQNQNASMTQNMQINPNGQTNMSQSMVPPMNSQAVA